MEFALKLDGEKFRGRRLRIQISKTQNPVTSGQKQKTDGEQKSGKTPARPSNATQGSFGGEKADSMKRLKLKKQKKIKKQKELRKQKKLAKTLSGADKTKPESKEQSKKEFKKLSKKVQVRNRLAKKKKKIEKK